jgi:hypothetical protein
VHQRHARARGRPAVAVPTVWLGPALVLGLVPTVPAVVISTRPRGNSNGLGIFFMSRARIRALARISSMQLCCCRGRTAIVPGGFVAVAM